MDGVHDLGGMHGFGPIDRSQEEHFPHHWERSVFQLTLACGMQGKWNLDMSRFARERMNPAHYLGSSYYEHWHHGLETLLRGEPIVGKDLGRGTAHAAASLRPVSIKRRMCLTPE